MSKILVSKWLNSDGTENYLVRCSVEFDGTTTPLTINNQKNVASITDVSTGQYTVNFLNPMIDDKYVALYGGQSGGIANVSWGGMCIGGGTYTPQSYMVRVRQLSSLSTNYTGQYRDLPVISFAVVR